MLAQSAFVLDCYVIQCELSGVVLCCCLSTVSQILRSGQVYAAAAMPTGGQWRILRHYLSLNNLQAELEKLLQRVKAEADPQQWDRIVRRLEKAMSVRLMQNGKEVEVDKCPVSSTSTQQPRPTDTQQPRPTDTQQPYPTDTQQSPAAGAAVGAEARDMTVRGLLHGLRRSTELHFGQLDQHAWRNNKPVVNKTSIHARTAYVISALVGAQSPASRLKRAADFIHHIHQYPEARDYAIKEGAVRALLRLQHAAGAGPRPGAGAEADELRGIVNEALALMGYMGPTRGPGPNILSLDGGGIRGLIAIEILRHLERLTGRPVNQLFDYIIGVSTGAIIAAVLGSGVGTLDTASQMYHTLSKEMFGNTSLLGGTSRLVWSHSYYDTAQWERLLRDKLGDATLSQCNRHGNPKMALVSCVVNSGSRLSPFLFRTYSVGFRRRGALRGSSHARVWQAVRASAAAPTYFDEFTLHGDVHQDGGIVVNNPCGVGVHEARLLFGAGALARATVLSLGTGQPPAAPAAPAAGTSWRDKFNKILDSATDTEGVHLLLNDLLPAGAYFRFNPPLMQPCNMDEVDPARLQDMITDTNAYIRRNQHKFSEAAARLTRPRGLLQRAADALHHRALLLGLTTHN